MAGAGYPVAEFCQEFDSEGSDTSLTPRSKGSPATGGSQGQWVDQLRNNELAQSGCETRRQEIQLGAVGCQPTRRRNLATVNVVSLLQALVTDLERAGHAGATVDLPLGSTNKSDLHTAFNEIAAQFPNFQVAIPLHTLASIPNEVFLLILSFLDAKSVFYAEKVSPYWYRQCASLVLWRNLCVTEWPRFTDQKDRELRAYNKNSVDGVNEKETPLFWKKTYVAKLASEKVWLSYRSKRFVDRTILTQQNGIHCIQFDQNELMTGSGIMHEIGIWDMKAPHELKSTLSGHTSAVTCLQFDQEQVVSGSLDSTVRIWDRYSHTCCKVLQGHSDKVWCVQFTGDRLVSGSSDKTVRVWNLESGEHLCSLQEHRTSVSCVRMDGSIVVSGSAGNSIRVWDIGNTPTCICKLRGHTKGVFCLQFDNAKIISGSLDNSIRVWDRRDSYKNVTNIMAGEPGEDKGIICFSYDDTKIVSGGADNVVKVWDMRMWKRIHTLVAHTHWITSIQFTDNILVTGSRDKSVKMWSVN